MNDSLKDFQNKMELGRRKNILANAFIKRGRDAGIPKNDLFIGPQEFQTFLDDSFHPNPKEFTNKIFTNKDFLKSKYFILIDGGNLLLRRRAASALLVRIITYDHYARLSSCDDVAHKLQVVSSNPEYNRNEIAEELKELDALALTEFKHNIFQKGFEIQTFFDEILDSRDRNAKFTIFTFANPLSKDERFMLSDVSLYGQYMCMFSQIANSPLSNTLHIRVSSKNIEVER
jgi:hypothetical protein